MKKQAKTLNEKLNLMFGVKTVQAVNSIKETPDGENRIVKAIGNTYFYIDSDMDMLVTGCCSKSINDRGPKSSAHAKIKHQQDHVLRTTHAVGVITELEERNIDGKTVLYFESRIPNTAKGDEHLSNYLEKIYDNHSIGFRYKQLLYASKDSENPEALKNWEEYYPMALNPEVADEHGYFWIVKEIELFEISVVSYGANTLTPNLGGKSGKDSPRLLDELISRVDILEKTIQDSTLDKDVKKTSNLEALQIKQIIKEIKLEKPSKKPTQINKESGIEDTDKKSNPYSQFINLKNI